MLSGSQKSGRMQAAQPFDCAALIFHSGCIIP